MNVDVNEQQTRAIRDVCNISLTSCGGSRGVMCADLLEERQDGTGSGLEVTRVVRIVRRPVPSLVLFCQRKTREIQRPWKVRVGIQVIIT